MSLTGVWLNELNSMMVLYDNGDGTLRGKYRSIVGRDPHIRDLTGRTSTEERGKQLLGFAVCFLIDHPGPDYGHSSLCVWSGWARANKITTHWLLTVDALKQQDEWSSTLLGEDSFDRVLNVPDEKHLEAPREVLSELLARVRKEDR